ncbi:MAG: GAF domain-containing protein [Chloroflexi bacterium]|nr:GAF domain-containing protein [Chloroflexota bacterium]
MIRARLLIGFVLVALLPVIGVGISTYLVSYQNGRQQSIDRLESVAARKELAIQVWVQSLEQELQVASQTDYSPKLISNALKLSNEELYYTWYNDLVRKRLKYFVDQSAQFEEMFLVNNKGEVVVSTHVEREPKSYSEFIVYPAELTASYAQFPFLWEAQNVPTFDQADAGFAFVLIPLNKEDGQFIGAIGGKVDIAALHEILNEKTGLGDTGQAYLVNWDYALLSGTGFSQTQDLGLVESDGIHRAIEQASSIAGNYISPSGRNVVGVYRWLPDLKIVLAVEQDSAEVFQAVSANTTINLVIAFIALVVAVVAALFMTQNIANPITELAKTASHIAEGDLEPMAKVVREDEVGALARAFNSMTAQIRDLINSLEQRVQERTHELREANTALEQRALQLETSAQVGREITSILDIDVLLNRVVELIQDAFGYYHVQIFLLEQDTRQFVMGASSGSRTSQRQRLDFGGNSIHNEAAQSGKIQLVRDTRKHPNFSFDEELPETRSELVIPLKIGSRVIGTLDVHASKADAFSEEDMLVIQSLGDQIAVAIENANLYNQSKKLAVLEERNRLSRELHDSVTQSLYSLVLFTEGWRRMLKKGNGKTVEEYLGRIGEIAQQSLKEMRLLILELRPPLLEQEGLVGALKKRLDTVEKRVGIEARVVMEDFIEIPPLVEEELYWIAQEALNNALKHARATQETVRIFAQDDAIVLEVADNGKGFSVRTVEKAGGMGMSNMRERARKIDGVLTVRSNLGKGTIIKVIVSHPTPQPLEA